MDSAVLETVQRGQWSPGDLLSSLYHSLQAFAVHSRSVSLPDGVLDGDTAGQDALNSAALEVATCQTSTATSENTAAAGPF